MNNEQKRALAAAIGVPAGCVALGSLLTGDALTEWYPKLKKSRFVLPLWSFIPVAVLYYVMCGVVLYRLLVVVAPGPRRTAALTLLLGMMGLNEAWNYVLFGRRSTQAGFWGLIGYTSVAVALSLALGRVDRTSARLMLPYLAWLGYDLVWTYELWRLNPSGDVADASPQPPNEFGV